MGRVIVMPSPAEGAARVRVPQQLYYWPRLDAFECLACGEMIEVPWKAVLRAGARPVAVKENPENLLLWRELMELDHAKCGRFHDDRMARQAREYRH